MGTNFKVMRLIFLCVVLLTSTGLFSQIRFNEIYLFPEGSGSSVERFIEIKNEGGKTISLDGYKVCALPTIKSPSTGCRKLDSYSSKSLLINPNEIKFIKINRTKASDNFIYLELPHENKNVFLLKDSLEQTVDVIDVSGKNRSKSIARKRENTWSLVTPTKGRSNKFNANTSFEFNPKEEVGKRELSWGSNNNLAKQGDNSSSSFPDETAPTKGNIFINEVFFVHEPDGYLNKDFWIELVNTSDEYVEIAHLTFSTDTLYGKTPISFRYNGDDSYELPPNSFIKINLTSTDAPGYLLYAQLPDKSSTIFLHDRDELIDEVTVEPLARHQSYSRLPDGVGGFNVVDVKTPNKTNAQLLPAYNTISKTTFFHTAGISLTDYNTLGEIDITSYRSGFDLGLGWERPKKRILTRYTVAYSRQSSGLFIDSTAKTPFGTIEIKTEGVSRVDYLKFKFDAGVAVTPQINLFLGTGVSVVLKQFTQADQLIVATLDDTGERFEERNRIEDVNAYRVDELDFDVSLALEYKIKDRVSLNLSYSRDYFSLAAAADAGIPNNKTVNQFLLRAIVPLYNSHKLKKRAFLLGPKLSSGYSL